jgi:S-layer family protein/glycosyl hydrolase family 26
MALMGLAPVLAHRADAGPVLLGLYSGVERDPANINSMLDVDAWLVPTGKRTAIAGLFMSVEDPSASSEIAFVFNAVWNQGYVPFMNLGASHSSALIVGGSLDGQFRDWAYHFALWASDGQRRAFIAVLPEMNGFWMPYGSDPVSFKQAFRRIRQIFEEELAGQGVSTFAVSWVFAANGWPGNAPDYYPGDDVVDVVSINAYNFGGCVGPGGTWDTFDSAIRPYLDQVAAMAPGKPIFIAETATVDVPAGGVGDKNQWLQELFTRLAAYPRFRGIVYLNRDADAFSSLPGCPLGADYRLHVPGTNLWPGFWNAMATVPDYVYWTPGSPQMASIVFGRQPTQIFADVPTFHPFAVEPGQVDFSPWIQALYAAGITGGCATSPPSYCPDIVVSRAQMAVFLLRGIYGRSFAPAPPTGVRFSDVPGDHPFAAWIEALANVGITAGCGAGNFCPEASVTRGQMAVFLLRSMYGSGYIPPPGTGTRFGDVPPGHPFVAWIEQLAAVGVTAGCGGGNFCPDAAVTRAQMAVFLVRAFNLAL